MAARPDYSLLARQLDAILDTRDWLTNASQTAAFINMTVENLNWAGFYVQRQPKVLHLGPFQGQPACHPIPFTKGVCGAAATQRTTQRIADVYEFPGHIACDAASRSELVVPVIVSQDEQEVLWGVLDLDSPSPGRFDAEDQAGIERLVGIFIASSDFDSVPS